MHTSTLDRTYKIMVVGSLFLVAIIVCKNIFIPLTFAGLFTILLLPFAVFLEKKTNRMLSIILVLLGSIAILSLLSWLVFSQISGLVRGLPNLENQYNELVNVISNYVTHEWQISTEEQAGLLKNGIAELSSSVGSLVLSTTYLLYFFVQVPIYIFLFLLYRERFSQFFTALLPSSNDMWKTEVQGVVRNYIGGLAIVVFIAGVMNSIGLLILGIDHAIFFGFLSGALTMIPYIGIGIGATLPALLALVTKDSIWYAVGVIAVHAFVQFLEGNFITPKITGSKISINALAAILALLFGGLIWGIAGMILAVPAIGVMKILFSYSSRFKPLVILLGDEDLIIDEAAANVPQQPEPKEGNETPEAPGENEEIIS